MCSPFGLPDLEGGDGWTDDCIHLSITVLWLYHLQSGNAPGGTRLPKAIFVALDGSRRTIDAAVGDSVMATAVMSGVPGIIGEWGQRLLRHLPRLRR